MGPGTEKSSAQIRHIDRAWASTVRAFQERTVDIVIAAMEANHPHLTTQKSFYVEISRARFRAELVTDDRKALGEQLEAATGKRIGALEAVEQAAERAESKLEYGVNGARQREAISHDAPELSKPGAIEAKLEL